MSEPLKHYEDSIISAVEQLNAMHSGEDPFNQQRYWAIVDLIEYWQERYWHLKQIKEKN